MQCPSFALQVLVASCSCLLLRCRLSRPSGCAKPSHVIPEPGSHRCDAPGSSRAHHHSPGRHRSQH
eukprot:2043467-Alexandrium_andersonii.AAC.1